MAGGLIQLAVYGSQDIFLTGTPQVTFFKMVYRRNTNFAIESIAQHFIGDINFGQEIMCVVDKLGDLMSRVNLEIDIPKVNLVKNSSLWTINKKQAKNEYEIMTKFYGYVYAYISMNIDIARKLHTLLKTNNIPLNDITNIMLDENFTKRLTNAQHDLETYVLHSNELNLISEFSENNFITAQLLNNFNIMKIYFSIVNNENNETNTTSNDNLDTIIKRKIFNTITNDLYPRMYDFYLKVYDVYLARQEKYMSFVNGTNVERYKFAWVEELGHAIIDFIDIKIGNQIIDKHTGDWLILFSKLFVSKYQMENYNKMIGNITSLTIFDDKIKNSYKLIIPFQFWFCRNTGLSLPLISLRYHNVIFTIKLKNLSQICYVENDVNLLSMEHIQSAYNINLVDAKLYIDYIFLDTEERTRFAQSTHEYLIEVVQYETFDDIVGDKYNAHLSFSHPTKFIIWYVQPRHYRENPTGHNKCQWNNFGTRPDKSGYTMITTNLRLNLYDRTDSNLPPEYYNYVQPYWYFNNDPTDGFCVYSFAIKPTLHQPSSTLNLSRIDDFGIIMNFTPEFKTALKNSYGIDETAHLGTYVMSYNILRFIGGMAGTAFQTD
ncbi:putative capsid protein 2 [Cotonvirus japonicus]|uniref:Capsid protein 2 n=1 Tax=Cotonvirus japonicus TaxID=2811091 RepID=A0ABM7NSH4_9VIRU|nr:putative capsid protein 2 [Cotonvirus japonicus]BCS83103.1 putative capsid protein 2 [Cotonvirus japonicus]